MTITELMRPVAQRKLTRHEYLKLAEFGAFDGERVELIDGAIYTMTPASPYHIRAIVYLTRVFTRNLDDGFEVGPQVSFAASEASHLEPDLAVVPAGTYDGTNHAERALLVIEVSRSSRHRDLGAKALLYARSDIPEYWVFDLDNRKFHRHTVPSIAGYQHVDVWDIDAPETPTGATFEGVMVNLAEVYGPVGEV